MSAATRTFTVEQANRMLPLVRRIVRDIVDAHRAWVRAVQAYETAATWARADAPASTLVQQEADVRRLAAEIEGYLGELRELGVDFKGFEPGLVDFPGERGGRPICLCWKLGEDAISYWHETTDGYAGRQPLTALPNARPPHSDA
ncbi:MAG: DUF2203 domain-containing protein [Gemmatimonadaceae bacterium]|nr:DUF2203 domain-containing protein [Gemmatimonadaceae bacterium]